MILSPFVIKLGVKYVAILLFLKHQEWLVEIYAIVLFMNLYLNVFFWKCETFYLLIRRVHYITKLIHNILMQVIILDF